MKFKTDHDLHIHSKLSSCSRDEGQTAKRILEYAESNSFKEICITDHFWDKNAKCVIQSKFYGPQDFEHISSILPLPQGENTKFYFGCETELDMDMNLGISDKLMDKFDFIIIPTTHMHMVTLTIDEKDTSFERRVDLYIKRLDKLLDMDLPFHKIGIAHLTCELMAENWQQNWQGHIDMVHTIDDEIFKSLFEKIKKKGAGVELNLVPSMYTDEDLEKILRPYRIAKEAGCKFYLGSDAHHPEELDSAMTRFTKIVDMLDLKEDDKFRIGKQ